MSNRQVNELKRLLDEHGVGYWDDEDEVIFYHDEKYNNIWVRDGELVMTVYPVTPQEAAEVALHEAVNLGSSASEGRG